MSKRVLMLLGDCPGMYVPMMYGLAQRLVSAGNHVVIASTTPYYERYTGVDFSGLAETFYVSEYLKTEINANRFKSIELDYWTIYPTYVRDIYFFGKHRNDWDTYKKIALFFKEIFEAQKIDLVVSEPPSNSFLYIGYSQAKKAGAEFIGFMSARIPSHINIFLDAYGQRLLTNPCYEKSSSKVVDGPPDYMHPRKAKLVRGGGRAQVRSFLQYLFSRSVETNSTPIHQLKSFYKMQLWRRLRAIVVRMKISFVNNVDSEEEINILFPLHLRPEATTSVLSRYYEDDLELLKNIAFSLPRNTKLYIKEHKPGLGLRNANFFKKAASLPNTLLLSPDYDLASNITKFDALVVLTSTAGFEAIRSGVPVLLLGNTFYSDYPGVIQIDSFSELEERLKRLTKNFAEPDETIMQRYLPKCFQGHFNYMDDDIVSDENLDMLLAPIVQVLETQQSGDLIDDV